MVEGCQMVGFGKRTGIELPAEKPGILPGSRAWRNRQSRRGDDPRPHRHALHRPGRHDGHPAPDVRHDRLRRQRRQILPAPHRPQGRLPTAILIEDKPKLEVDLIEAGIKPKDIELIRKGMWMAVNVNPAAPPAASKCRNRSRRQNRHRPDHGQWQESNNSWVISFAPYDDRNTPSASWSRTPAPAARVCGPLVHLIYRGLFARDEGLKLPLKAQKNSPATPTASRKSNFPRTCSPPSTRRPRRKPSTRTGETGDEIGTGEAPSTQTGSRPRTTRHPRSHHHPRSRCRRHRHPRAVPVPEP
jgi:penicillin-binding protein 2